MNTITIKPSKPFFYNPGFILFVVILALLNNLEHSTHVYHSISKTNFTSDWMNWVYCILVNLLIDLSVIAFVVNGRHKEAGIYAFLIFIINLLYYDGLEIFPIQINNSIAYVTYSSMFTYSIYTFSKLYFERVNSQEKDHNLRAELDSFSEKMHQADDSIKAFNETIRQKDIEIRKLNELMLQLSESNKDLTSFKIKRISELTCKDCGHVAENDFGVSGHKKGCKTSHS